MNIDFVIHLLLISTLWILVRMMYTMVELILMHCRIMTMKSALTRLLRADVCMRRDVRRHDDHDSGRRSHLRKLIHYLDRTHRNSNPG